MLGFKFRRQHVIDGFVVDFYCAELGLVLEIDGPVHSLPDQVGYDQARERHMKCLGLRVVRLTNAAVSEVRLHQVLRTFISSPLSRKGEGARG